MSDEKDNDYRIYSLELYVWNGNKWGRSVNTNCKEYIKENIDKEKQKAIKKAKEDAMHSPFFIENISLIKSINFDKKLENIIEVFRKIKSYIS